MIDTLSFAAAGIRSSANQFASAAERVVKASGPQSKTDCVIAADDLPSAVVDSQLSALSFKANTAVFKTADKMMGTLLDTLA